MNWWKIVLGALAAAATPAARWLTHRHTQPRHAAHPEPELHHERDFYGAMTLEDERVWPGWDDRTLAWLREDSGPGEGLSSFTTPGPDLERLADAADVAAADWLACRSYGYVQRTTEETCR